MSASFSDRPSHKGYPDAKRLYPRVYGCCGQRPVRKVSWEYNEEDLVADVRKSERLSAASRERHLEIKRKADIARGLSKIQFGPPLPKKHQTIPHEEITRTPVTVVMLNANAKD